MTTIDEAMLRSLLTPDGDGAFVTEAEIDAALAKAQTDSGLKDVIKPDHASRMLHSAVLRKESLRVWTYYLFQAGDQGDLLPNLVESGSLDTAEKIERVIQHALQEQG